MADTTNNINNDNNTKNVNITKMIATKIANTYNESVKYPNFLSFSIIYIILFFFIMIIPFFLYNLAYGNGDLNQRTINYVVFYMLFFVILYLSILFLDNQSRMMTKNPYINIFLSFFVMLVVIVMIGVAIYFYNYESNLGQTYTAYANIILYVIVFLMVITSLALFYKVFMNNLQKQRGIIGFIINFIFFLPCLFTDFIEFLKLQLRITPNIVYILFIIEILLIIAFIYIPIAIDSNINKNQKPLLPEPTFISNSRIIGNCDNLSPLITKDSNGSETKTPRANYGLSMWIYLNQQANISMTPRLINIFSYGSTNSMKPQVAYFEKKSQEKNATILRITFTGKQEGVNHDVGVETSYDIEVPNQKWNHLFFNYHSSSVDLFVNGILERTFQMNGNNPVYSLSDLITIGDNNGLDGAICNVTYYTDELTKFQITNLYNLLHNKNPPINNII